MTSDRIRVHSKEVYVCRYCGEQWDTRGAAEICNKKDRILALTDHMDGNRALNLNEIIDHMEREIEENGEL